MIGSKYNKIFFVLSLIFLNLSSFKIINTMEPEPGTGSELSGVEPGFRDDSSSDRHTAYAGSDKDSSDPGIGSDIDDGLAFPGATSGATGFDSQNAAYLDMAERMAQGAAQIDALVGERDVLLDLLREEEIAHAVRLQA